MRNFKAWKNYVKRFSNDVVFRDYDVNLHYRNDKMKLQSFIYINYLHQDKGKNLFQCSCYKSRYIENKLEIANLSS